MIRLATPTDAPALAIMLDDFNKEFGDSSPGVDFLNNRISTLLQKPEFFIVVPNEHLVAFGLVTLRPNVWSPGLIAVLDELYTKPEHRNQGFGSEILKGAITEANRRGATDFAIEVDESDTNAHRFYARHSFPLKNPEYAYILWRDISDKPT
jgi:hypothetical protein